MTLIKGFKSDPPTSGSSRSARRAERGHLRASRRPCRVDAHYFRNIALCRGSSRHSGAQLRFAVDLATAPPRPMSRLPTRDPPCGVRDVPTAGAPTIDVESRRMTLTATTYVQPRGESISRTRSQCSSAQRKCLVGCLRSKVPTTGQHEQRGDQAGVLAVIPILEVAGGGALQPKLSHEARKMPRGTEICEGPERRGAQNRSRSTRFDPDRRSGVRGRRHAATLDGPAPAGSSVWRGLGPRRRGDGVPTKRNAFGVQVIWPRSNGTAPHVADASSRAGPTARVAALDPLSDAAVLEQEGASEGAAIRRSSGGACSLG